MGEYTVNGEIILRMKNISKSFPGVQALKNVSFDLKRERCMPW